MKAEPIINSFVAGELSPRLRGRTDVAQYFQSAKEIRNMLVEFYGGVKKAPGTSFVEETKSFIELDFMEYSTDALAQAAYVSGASGAIYAQQTTNNGSIYIGTTSNAGLNYWTGQSFTLSQKNIITQLKVTFNANTGSPAGQVTCRIETDSGGVPSGTLAHASATSTFTPSASAENTINFTDFQLDAGTYWIVLKAPDQVSLNTRWNVAVNTSGGYSGGAEGYWESGTWHILLTDDIVFKLYTNPLVAYSESVIKRHGAYSLNGIALATNSLNQTLTRTVSSPIDLTGKTSLTFQLFSSRTGANIKIGIHDSGGTTSEKTHTVVTANTWESVTWDISGVTNANKNAIDSIIITILNADADNTFYIDDFKESSSSIVRIIPFIFSDTQAYIIEVGNLYMRFYKDDGQILSGGNAYEIATSYLADDIFDLQFAQTADILYITHPDYPQAKLTRTGHAAWTLTAIDYSTGSARPALMVENITATTITPSGTTGGVDLVASAALFYSGHVGSIWKMNGGYVKIDTVSDTTHAHGAVLYSGSITSSSASSAWSEGSWSAHRGYPRSVTISEDRLIYSYTAYQPQTTWGSTTGGYDTFELGSDAADAFSFKADTNKVEVINWLFPANEILVGTISGVSALGTGSDTTALTATSGRMKKKVRDGASLILPQAIGNNVFYWQKYNRILREYIYSLDDDSYVSNDATAFSDHITESGIVDMAYQQAPINILWCVRADGKLAAFTRQIDQKVAAWTLHDTQGYYESVAVIPKESYDEVWFVVRREVEGVTKRYIEYMTAPDFEDQEDMFFVHSGLTLDEPVDILNATQTNPVVITATAHGFSDGDTVRIRNVEGMTELNYTKFTVANKTDNTFELSGIDGTAYTAYESDGEVRECVNSVSGLDHLEGMTVQVLADGDDHADCVVTSGAITLDGYYSQVTVGLGYTARLKTNDLEASPGGATSQGKVKRVSEVRANLYRSLECQVGTDDKTDPLTIPRAADLPAGQATPVYTGMRKLPFPSGYDTSKEVVIEQPKCLALHVLSIIAELECN